MRSSLLVLCKEVAPEVCAICQSTEMPGEQAIVAARVSGCLLRADPGYYYQWHGSGSGLVGEDMRWQGWLVSGSKR